MSSKDLKTWKFEKPVFAEAPQWAVEAVKEYKGHTWAPDIVYHNGLYSLVLFLLGICQEYFGYRTCYQSDA